MIYVSDVCCVILCGADVFTEFAPSVIDSASVAMNDDEVDEDDEDNDDDDDKKKESERPKERTKHDNNTPKHDPITLTTSNTTPSRDATTPPPTADIDPWTSVKSPRGQRKCEPRNLIGQRTPSPRRKGLAKVKGKANDDTQIRACDDSQLNSSLSKSMSDYLVVPKKHARTPSPQRPQAEEEKKAGSPRGLLARPQSPKK